MLGYLLDTKTGAASYNLFHHKGVAIALAAIGYYLHNEALTAIGIFCLPIPLSTEFLDVD